MNRTISVGPQTTTLVRRTLDMHACMGNCVHQIRVTQSQLDLKMVVKRVVKYVFILNTHTRIYNDTVYPSIAPYLMLSWSDINTDFDSCEAKAWGH